MGKAVLVVGGSGTGKSRSMKNLDPKTTFIINVAGKDLPFRSSDYMEKTKDGKVGNILNTSNPESILVTLNKLPASRPTIKEIVIDDYQYFMAFIYISRIGEKQYFEKFNDILRYTKAIHDAIKESREDLIVYILCHSEDIDEFNRKAKTAGKAVDKYLTLEGLFTTVLWTRVNHTPGDPPKNEYYFETQADGTNTAKSPEELLDFRIENDLSLVSKAIREYYGI